LDIGERRIGVALSDALGLTAQPLMAQHAVQAVVVGLPLTLRGEQGPQANKVIAFVDALRRQAAVPVELLDERLTTVQGARALQEAGRTAKQRKRVVDRVAAQLILQHYLEVKRPSSREAEEP
jgi:putative Holliday junction resolvase